MPRIIRNTDLPTCQVCQKRRQRSAFFREHNPEGTYITCKKCSLQDNIYCPACSSIHSRVEMLPFLGKVGVSCPASTTNPSLPATVAPVAAPMSAPADPAPRDVLLALVKTLELLADKVTVVESQTAQLLSRQQAPLFEPVDTSGLETRISELEAREREALENFCNAEDARKQLEQENSRLKAELESKSSELSSLGEGREQLLQQLWRVHDILRS